MDILDTLVALVHCNDDVCIRSDIVRIILLSSMTPLPDDIFIINLETNTARRLDHEYSSWSPIRFFAHSKVVKNILVFVQVEQIINVFKSSISPPEAYEFGFDVVVDPIFYKINVFVLGLEIGVQESQHC